MPETYRETINRAFGAAIEAHNGITGLSREEERETMVWHMLRSAMEYCAYHGLSFDQILAEVREDIATVGL